MLSRLNTLRQFTNSADFSFFHRAGMPWLMVAFCAYLVAGCTSRRPVGEGAQPVVAASAVPSPLCEQIRLFLDLEAVQGKDFSLLRDRSWELLSRSREQGESCAGADRLRVFYQQLDLRMPRDPKWRVQHEQVDKLERAILFKSESFVWRLPGQKPGGSRLSYIKRLAHLADRNRRQSLYKLFNHSRSRKWNAWGFRDLLSERKQEARIAGYQSYLEYALGKSGQDYAAVMKNSQSIRAALSEPVKAWLKYQAGLEGISTIEPWDLAFLFEKGWGPSLADRLKSSTSQDLSAFARGFLNDMGFDFSSVAGTENPKILQFNLDLPVVRSDYGWVVGDFMIQTYLNEVRQPIPLFQVPLESSQEAIGKAFAQLALNSVQWLNTLSLWQGPPSPVESESRRPIGLLPFALLAYRDTFLYTFESRCYEQSEVEPAEIWGQVHREFFDVDTAPFYGGFDDDHFLRNPGIYGEKALGLTVAAGLVGYITDNYGPKFSPALGPDLKRDWFASGSELSTWQLLRRFTKQEFRPDSLVEKLQAAVEAR